MNALKTTQEASDKVHPIIAKLGSDLHNAYRLLQDYHKAFDAIRAVILQWPPHGGRPVVHPPPPQPVITHTAIPAQSSTT